MAEGGVESLSVAGSEFVFEFFCEFCNEEGIHKEAAGHCTECDEYFCGSCVSHHKRNRLSRHHEILEKENMPRTTPPSSDRVQNDISTMCKQHKGEPVKYYCKTHEVLVCSECIIEKHKTCTDTVNIVKTTNTFFDDKEYKDFIQKLKTLQTQVHNITTKSREQITTSERYCDEAIEAVRQFRENIIWTLDDIETRLKKKADNIKRKDITNMKSLENTCSTVQEKLDKISSEFESLKSDKRVCQSYIQMKETTVHVNEIEKQLKSAEDKCTIDIYTFISNTKLTEILREHDGFGTISLNSNEHKFEQKQESIANVIKSKTNVQGKNISLTGKNEDKTKSAPKPKVVSSASFIHEIEVRSTSDRNTCWIAGSVVLSDIRLLVVDQNNRKVKLINTQTMRLISELDISGAPWDVTVITGDHVAVTVPEKNKILILKVTDSIIKEREIRVKGKCNGIVYSKNQLIVSYCGPAKLEIMDLKGNVNVIIDTDKDGNKLFNEPRYICVSNDGDTIYVSDCKYKAGRVISMSRNGTVKAIYTDRDLDGPQKMCIDHRGNVFVCGYYSRNIHMLTPNCTKINIILTQTDGLSISVSSVSHRSRMDRLFVGMNNMVKVYQLS